MSYSIRYQIQPQIIDPLFIRTVSEDGAPRISDNGVWTSVVYQGRDSVYVTIGNNAALSWSGAHVEIRAPSLGLSGNPAIRMYGFDAVKYLMQGIESKYSMIFTEQDDIFDVYDSLFDDQTKELDKYITSIDGAEGNDTFDLTRIGTREQFQVTPTSPQSFRLSKQGSSWQVELKNFEYVKFSDADVISLPALLPASYNLSTNTSIVSEGQTAALTLFTTNVATGTSMSYKISGVSGSDLVGGQLSGSVTIGADGRATISLPIAADNLTEGNENLTIQIQGQSATITLLDTSTSSVDSYSLSSPQNSASEGTEVSFILSGTNTVEGTSIEFFISGVSSSDIEGETLSGSTIFSTDGIATISLKLAADNLIEGDETLTLTSNGKSISLRVIDTGALNSNVIPNMFNGSDVGDFLSRSVWDLADTIFQGAGGDDVFWSGGGKSTVFGGSGDDSIYSLRANQTLKGEAGNDNFFFDSNSIHWNTNVDGGDGLDTIWVGLKAAFVTVTSAYDTGLHLASGGAHLSLSEVERIMYDDASIAFDVTGNAGKAYRIYKAAFARDPMTGDKAGLGYWINKIDNGMDMVEVAGRFIDSPEFRTLYGQNPSNADFLTKVYTNVLGRTPDQRGYDWWLNELNTNPSKTKAKVLADFAESGENQAGVASLVGNGIQYTEFVT